MKYFRVNLVDPTFDFIIHLPRIEFKGKYDLKVRVVLLDIAGKGDIVGLLEDFKARVKLRGKKYQKDGQTYMHFEKVQIKIQLGRSKLDLKNLFDNNPTLSRVGNEFVNNNSGYFVTEIIPALGNIA